MSIFYCYVLYLDGKCTIFNILIILQKDIQRDNIKIICACFHFAPVVNTLPNIFSVASAMDSIYISTKKSNKYKNQVKLNYHNMNYAKRTLSLITIINLMLAFDNLCSATSETNDILKHYEMYINNGFEKGNNNIRVHCQSKDDDLGFHTLLPGEEFHWRFRENFWATTLYFCHFWWGSKDANFIVFDQNLSVKCNNPSHQCCWKADELGFFFSYSNSGPWLYMHGWSNN